MHRRHRAVSERVWGGGIQGGRGRGGPYHDLLCDWTRKVLWCLHRRCSRSAAGSGPSRHSVSGKAWSTCQRSARRCHCVAIDGSCLHRMRRSRRSCVRRRRVCRGSIRCRRAGFTSEGCCRVYGAPEFETGRVPEARDARRKVLRARERDREGSVHRTHARAHTHFKTQIGLHGVEPVHGELGKCAPYLGHILVPHWLCPSGRRWRWSVALHRTGAEFELCLERERYVQVARRVLRLPRG